MFDHWPLLFKKLLQISLALARHVLMFNDATEFAVTGRLWASREQTGTAYLTTAGCC
jgi:hypothetical protein